MHRSLFALCFLAASLAAQPTRARIGLPGFKDMFPIEDVTVPYTLDAPVGAAFDSLKVPVQVDDSAGGIIGNVKLSARTSFAGYRLSRLLDCGTTTMGQNNADSFRLTMVFLALLDPVDVSHARVRIGFIAGGEPIAGSRRDAVTCGSTGVIEAKLVALASARLK
jgi:hypothetical protein